MSDRETERAGTHRSQDVSAHHPVRLLVTQDLHQAVCVCVGLRSAVGRKGEFADLVWNTLHRTQAEINIGIISHTCP